MNLAYLAFGANLGDRVATWQRTLPLCDQLPHSEVVAASSLYETEPVGGPPQPHYLNAAIALRTALAPQALLRELLAMEQILGRVRNVRWGPRTVDLDLLLMDDTICDEPGPPHLQLPHPHLHERRFVLVPLAEIAPDVIHPQQQRTIQELLEACPDASDVVPFAPAEPPEPR